MSVSRGGKAPRDFIVGRLFDAVGRASSNIDRPLTTFGDPADPNLAVGALPSAHYRYLRRP
jgi:hypothetical protein